MQKLRKSCHALTTPRVDAGRSQKASRRRQGKAGPGAHAACDHREMARPSFPKPTFFLLLKQFFQRPSLPYSMMYPYTQPTYRGLQKTERFSSFNTGIIFLTRPFLQTLVAPSISPSPFLCLFWLPEPWSSRPRTRSRAHPRKRQPSSEAARLNFPPTHNAPRPHQQ